MAQASKDYLAELTRRRDESGGMRIPTLDEWGMLTELALAEQQGVKQEAEEHAPDMATYLDRMADSLKKIHHAALFDGTLDPLDHYPFAAQFFLSALGHLESSASMLKLAELSIKASEVQEK